MGQTTRADVTGGGRWLLQMTELVFLRLTLHWQRALSNQPWKEYTAEGGRKYWYNTETKQSSWEMPEAYKNALVQTPSTKATSA